MSKLFEIETNHEPAGDQPLAIKNLLEGLNDGLLNQTLLGVTGSGKTFTVANVIKEKPVSEAIRKMTSYPAKRLGRSDRRIIKEKSPDSVIDRATYEMPRQYPKGIEHVIVTGV